ncbi:hypothetical protein BKA64DRAFT_343964 [Cadophora sp. MPI-SDFR-AT-0126]|nr:hypothetical protein BKA64DRAFT_343964 [Leotiomycetes sp. MPI-SDFR-AT-0126]
MASQRPRPVVIDLLSSDEDAELQSPPRRQPVRQTGPIDLRTPSPPSRPLHTGASSARLHDGEPSVVTSNAPPMVDQKDSMPKSPGRATVAPAVTFSPRSSTQTYSTEPLSIPNFRPTFTQSRASPRNSTEAANKESPSYNLPFGRPPTHAYPIRTPVISASKDSPDLVTNPIIKPSEAVLRDMIRDDSLIHRVAFLAEDDDDDEDQDEDDEIEDIFPPGVQMVPNGSPAKQANSDRKSRNDNSSIGSTSPLITRLQQRKQKQTAREPLPERRSQSPRQRMARLVKPNTQENASGLEDRLRGFLQGMRDDHALSTRYILADAREVALERNILAVDKISPFASMTSVTLEPGAPVPFGKTKDVLHHYPVQKNGKLGKGKSTLLAKPVSGDTPRVPKYSSHTNVRRNILKADDEKLKFIPFLGDSRNEANFRRLVKELEQVYSPRSSETSREAEENSRIRQYLPMWLDDLQLGFDLQALKHYLLQQDEESGELGIEPRNRRLLLESLGEPLDTHTRQAASMFCDAFDKVFDIATQDVVLPASLLKEMIEAARNEVEKKKPSPASNRIGTYADLTCLICAAIDCPTHGDFIHERIDSSDVDDDGHEGPPEMKYDPKPLNLNYEDTLRRYENRAKDNIESLPQNRKKSCSNECYMATDFSDLDYEFDEEHLAVLPQMIATYRHPNYRSCYIAYALNIPCWTVWAEIQRYESEHPKKEVEEPPPGRARKPEWYDNKKKALRGDLNDYTTAHLHQERKQAVACGHPGPCIVRPGDKETSCPCASSNILCESFCGCSDDCPRRFTGCACLAFGLPCTSDSCICIKMNRECGPECDSCGALARINPANKYDDELFTTGCQNVYLQRGVSKAMVMGESQLVGFGLYLAEPVKKGDYLSEYSGENISSEEADRRGIVYDRKFLSFLFDLNKERVIDAARLGNKTRFINHSGSLADGLNCEAKIVLVNGEHRIKFVAIRDIDVGEELLFNYGKKFAEKQGLNKTLPKAKAGGKRGVLEGEEALDALDGMDQRKKGTREKINAIRGGGKVGDKKGRGSGSKMRKTAAPMGPVVEEEIYAAQAEEDAEEYDDDLRPRRKRFRPARYTR